VLFLILPHKKKEHHFQGNKKKLLLFYVVKMFSVRETFFLSFSLCKEKVKLHSGKLSAEGKKIIMGKSIQMIKESGW
jgi:hypothetical protein